MRNMLEDSALALRAIVVQLCHHYLSIGRIQEIWGYPDHNLPVAPYRIGR
jgi:hypothetical protein